MRRSRADYHRAVRRTAAAVGLAIAGSQAGHLLAYELRFGAAAPHLQSIGAHAYFPLLVKTIFGAGALALIASLLLLGFARLASGRKIEKQSAPSLLRLLAVLYTLQLVFFIGQETLEGSSAGDLYLWGLLAQLPVALAGAVALRWLFAELGPALAELSVQLRPVLRLTPNVIAMAVWPVAAEVVQGVDVLAPSFDRGPPSF